MGFSNNKIRWIFAAIGAAIIGLFVSEFWQLIKAGALFDALEGISGEVKEANFIRTDLVDTVKQSIAQWVLSFSGIIATILVFLTKTSEEEWMGCFISGIVYGFTLGIGVLFLLSNFERFKDIHLAVGNAQYAMAGLAIIMTLVQAFIIRIRDK